ncbi:hypothetical protein ACRBEV_12735 [Methylobacterium phyllosphaerae]
MGTLSTKSAIIAEREFKRTAGGSPVICRQRLMKRSIGRSARASISGAESSRLEDADMSMRLNGSGLHSAAASAPDGEGWVTPMLSAAADSAIEVRGRGT